MDLLLGLDAIAAKRGDGLRPELRALLRPRAEAPPTDPIAIEASICTEADAEPKVVRYALSGL